ncbi:hypothetical protein [Dactylosporangium sp. CA-233914]|uniref:hypothetical protein n=1 Tax=Dactylosporangium sp. CA-233914 TaxID=3239934 RepID=UPI003D8B10C7
MHQLIAAFVKPILLSWAPGGRRPLMRYTLGGHDPTHWTASVTADAGRAGVVTAGIGPYVAPPADLVEGTGEDVVVQQLPDSPYALTVTIRPPVEPAEAARIAEGVDTGLGASTDWLGG